VKGDRLGEFEELLLLTLRGLGDDTYAVPVQQQMERATGRHVSMGAVYASLDRLEDKGFVRSSTGEPTRERGGKRKRLFAITRTGMQVVDDVRRVRDALWRVIEARK
jgi:PadR family transcriptional regulator PadR